MLRRKLVKIRLINQNVPYPLGRHKPVSGAVGALYRRRVVLRS